MVLVCMERNEVERNTTVCVGRLTIIAIMLFAVDGGGCSILLLKIILYNYILANLKNMKK